MLRDLEIDLPDVVAEVTAAFNRYEKALVTNDVAVLDDTFRVDPRTIRYGGARFSRSRRDRGVPRGAFAGRPRPHDFANGDHHVWPRLRRGLDAVPSRHRARDGRPADADLGAVCRRLARGRRPCQRRRRERGLEKIIRRNDNDDRPAHCRHLAAQEHGRPRRRRHRAGAALRAAGDGARGVPGRRPHDGRAVRRAGELPPASRGSSCLTPATTASTARLSTRVDASSDGSRVGGDQVRHVSFKDGLMVLAPPRRLYAGVMQHQELVWERIAD